jgi:hypothetical protein
MLLLLKRKGKKEGSYILRIFIINEGKAIFWLPTKLKTIKQAIRDKEAIKQ